MQELQLERKDASTVVRDPGRLRHQSLRRRFGPREAPGMAKLTILQALKQTSSSI